MPGHRRLISLSLSAVTLTLCCAAPPAPAADCWATLDAGSSATRLYVYEERNGQWLAHPGPTVGALADPVRGIRGKTWEDAPAVVREVVDTLDAIKADGPPDDQGKPRWQGFDWSRDCTLRSAAVYATGGMRIAEQQDPRHSLELWSRLDGALRQRLGPGVKVRVKTLSGFEEGLYAWLSLSVQGRGRDFGVVEMGGASAQVTFPCPDCPEARPVLVDGLPLKVFGHSFLGLGGDEASTTLGLQPACAFAAGKADPSWTEQRCADTIPLVTAEGVQDPYDYGPSGRGTFQRLPPQLAEVRRWYVTGAFNYMTDRDIQTCCVEGGRCFEAPTSCFRSVYFRKYLKDLGVRVYEKAVSRWTLGAVVCDLTDCLGAVPVPDCRWMKDGCLLPPGAGR